MCRRYSKAISSRHLVNYYYLLWNLINLLRFGSTGKLLAVMVLLSSRGGVCLFLCGIMVVVFAARASGWALRCARHGCASAGPRPRPALALCEMNNVEILDNCGGNCRREMAGKLF